MKSSDDGLKQRLIGAVVLLAIAVIFLPVLFDRKRLEPIDTQTQIPAEPDIAPLIVEAPEPPTDMALAPEPQTMFVPEETDMAELEPEPIGLDATGDVASWVLQVASFREADHAARLRQRLIDAGYTAFSRESQFKNGSVVRVYVGPKLDKAELERLKAEIDAKFEVQALLLEFRPY